MNNKKNNVELIIHRQRIGDEIIFQYLVKQDELSGINVGYIKNLSRCLGTLFRNLEFGFQIEDAPNVIVTDETANDPEWITDLLRSRYSK